MKTLVLSMFIMTILWVGISSMNSSNPMKMCWKLMVLICSITICMWMMTSFSWISLVMTLVFLGGILMIFMMISSLIPSEVMKMNPLKKYNYIMVLLIFYFMANSFQKTENCSIMKMYVQSTDFIIFSFILMALYLVCSGTILSMDFTSIRYHV